MLRQWLARLRGPAVPVQLFTRADCGLCDAMKRDLKRARFGRRFELEEIDISTDPELELLYGRSIPVLKIAGRTAFKGRMTPDQFAVKFDRLSVEWLRAQSVGRALSGVAQKRKATEERSRTVGDPGAEPTKPGKSGEPKEIG